MPKKGKQKELTWEEQAAAIDAARAAEKAHSKPPSALAVSAHSQLQLQRSGAQAARHRQDVIQLARQMERDRQDSQALVLSGVQGGGASASNLKRKSKAKTEVTDLTFNPTIEVQPVQINPAENYEVKFSNFKIVRRHEMSFAKDNENTNGFDLCDKYVTLLGKDYYNAEKKKQESAFVLHWYEGKNVYLVDGVATGKVTGAYLTPCGYPAPETMHGDSIERDTRMCDQLDLFLDANVVNLKKESLNFGPDPYNLGIGCDNYTYYFGSNGGNVVTQTNDRGNITDVKLTKGKRPLYSWTESGRGPKVHEFAAEDYKNAMTYIKAPRFTATFKSRPDAVNKPNEIVDVSYIVRMENMVVISKKQITEETNLGKAKRQKQKAFSQTPMEKVKEAWVTVRTIMEPLAGNRTKEFKATRSGMLNKQHAIQDRLRHIATHASVEERQQFMDDCDETIEQLKADAVGNRIAISVEELVKDIINTVIAEQEGSNPAPHVQPLEWGGVPKGPALKAIKPEPGLAWGAKEPQGAAGTAAQSHPLPLPRGPAAAAQSNRAWNDEGVNPGAANLVTLQGNPNVAWFNQPRDRPGPSAAGALNSQSSFPRTPAIDPWSASAQQTRPSFSKPAVKPGFFAAPAQAPTLPSAWSTTWTAPGNNAASLPAFGGNTFATSPQSEASGIRAQGYRITVDDSDDSESDDST